MADGSLQYPAGCCATLQEATSSRQAAKLTLQLSVFVPPAPASYGSVTPHPPNKNPRLMYKVSGSSPTCSGKKLEQLFFLYIDVLQGHMNHLYYYSLLLLLLFYYYAALLSFHSFINSLKLCDARIYPKLKRIQFDSIL